MSEGKAYREPAPEARRLRELEKHVSDLRQQVSQLEGLAQLRSQQLSEIAHELRSPLVAVSGYAKLLLKEQAGKINSVQREYLEVIRGNTAKMTEAISHAVPTPACEPLRFQVFDIRELWQETANITRSHGPISMVLLNVHFPPEPCLAFANRDQLSLVFYRLLMDAAKACGVDGKIELEMSQREGKITTRLSRLGPSSSSHAPATATVHAGVPMELSPAICDTIRAHGRRCLGARTVRRMLGGFRHSSSGPIQRHIRGYVELNEQANRVGCR